MTTNTLQLNTSGNIGTSGDILVTLAEALRQVERSQMLIQELNHGSADEGSFPDTLQTLEKAQSRLIEASAAFVQELHTQNIVE